MGKEQNQSQMALIQFRTDTTGIEETVTTKLDALVAEDDVDGVGVDGVDPWFKAYRRCALKINQCVQQSRKLLRKNSSRDRFS